MNTFICQNIIKEIISDKRMERPNYFHSYKLFNLLVALILFNKIHGNIAPVFSGNFSAVNTRVFFFY